MQPVRPGAKPLMCRLAADPEGTADLLPGGTIAFPSCDYLRASQAVGCLGKSERGHCCVEMRLAVDGTPAKCRHRKEIPDGGSD